MFLKLEVFLGPFLWVRSYKETTKVEEFKKIASKHIGGKKTILFYHSTLNK